MKVSTYIEALQYARERQLETARCRRQGLFMIAIADDSHALWYRRYKRLAEKIERRLISAVGDVGVPPQGDTT